MTPQSQPETNALEVVRDLLMTISRGERLIHARNHKSKFGNAKTVKRADPATSDTSPADGIASRKARATEDRDDERIAALFVMPRVYQQRKAVDSSSVMVCGSVMIEILEVRKIFSGSDLGIGSVILFRLQNHKKRHCQSDKIRLFDRGALISVSGRSL
jgi:hypothetical protein